MFLKLLKGLFKKPCRIDWDLSREEWIKSVLADLVPKLQQDQRFERSGDLISRFNWEIKISFSEKKFKKLFKELV